ncbi:MAG: DNA (cytosine-5-)-methyltransferase [Anaerolineae bacterium]|nr:DNA (cytosine-5-)-methyltransferase [Anaerolineae bacterium]
MPVTAVSLFSGCGGFDMGAKKAGVKILWANDINPHAAATYQKYLPEVEFHLGNIKDFDKKQLPEADLLIGCYPCQGFSAAAWRRWRERDKRDLFENLDNFLFLEFVNAIPYVKPKFVFIENVRGLKSSAGGWFFQAQKEALEAAGFIVFSEKLNIKNFGVPQSRERIFIVGVHKDTAYRYSFPELTHGPDRQIPYRSQQDVIGELPEWPVGEFQTKPFHGHYLTRNRKKSWESYSYTIVAHSHHVPLHPMGEPMAKVGKDHWELRGTANRRLSWRECALLQSFSGDFEPDGPLAAKYAQIGNAVPPLMGELVTRPAAQFLEQGNRIVEAI